MTCPHRQQLDLDQRLVHAAAKRRFCATDARGHADHLSLQMVGGRRNRMVDSPPDFAPSSSTSASGRPRRGRRTGPVARSGSESVPASPIRARPANPTAPMWRNSSWAARASRPDPKGHGPGHHPGYCDLEGLSAITAHPVASGSVAGEGGCCRGQLSRSSLPSRVQAGAGTGVGR
jgi:hypothetical protein